MLMKTITLQEAYEIFAAFKDGKFSNKCLHPNTHVEDRVETYEVKGKDIKINSRVRVCDDCKEELFDRELDTDNLINAYDEYRKLEGLLTSHEIREIRENLGIEPETLDKLILANGGSTRRYENGSIQSNLYDAFVRLTKEPNAVKILVNLPYSKLSRKEKEILLNQRGNL